MRRTLTLIAVGASLLLPPVTNARQSSSEDQFEGQMIAWTGMVTQVVSDILYLEGEAFDITVGEDDTIADAIAEAVATLRAIDANVASTTPPASYSADHQRFQDLLARILTAGEGCLPIDDRPSADNGAACNDGLLDVLNDYSGFIEDFTQRVLEDALSPQGTPTTVTPRSKAEPTSSTYTITGTLTLIDFDEHWRKDRDCYGSGGYRDISGGADVTVRNGDDDIVGVSRLDDGEPSFNDDIHTTTSFCDFAFAVDVTAERFYSIEIGSRGDLSYSFDDLENSGWTIALSIGQA